ncbi:GDP-mannose 4,6-dehydratase [Parvularcula marina]|uniref:GDP-mannose 4,6-dehydratase n=1 Tax=Parvularcula marina TaxID=2292771 RepID=A0A371RGE8_9PROT|nr:GDP-mannose 4,6-dehydratase [Parvularcula marina]RFB04495.1 GDP-mannose 4,6-dehydratase [Parvularcula marina]
MTKSAFITGITGQDGSYLTELLLEKGYTVHGTVRRSSSIARPRLEHLVSNDEIYNKRLFLHYADLLDMTAMKRLLEKLCPDEFYHFAGQSHVGLSFEIPVATADLSAIGALKLLELFRELEKPPRLMHIASSELFGAPDVTPQNEQTAVRPTSPYGAAKAFAFDCVRIYRNTYGLFATNAIAYNHESPRRGEAFVTRKIVKGVADIVRGRQSVLKLGNLDVERDWGYAPEYVEAMWRILQQETPDDFVIASGKLTTLRDFLRYAFEAADLDWEKHVEIDPRFFRPSEPKALCGDPAKAERVLGWRAQTGPEALAELMVKAELDGNTP